MFLIGCQSAMEAEYESDTEAVYITDDSALDAAYWDGWNDRSMEIPPPVECDSDAESVAAGLYAEVLRLREYIDDIDADYVECVQIANYNSKQAVDWRQKLISLCNQVSGYSECEVLK